MSLEKLIIFDCDGVLVDSEGISSQTESEELTRQGFPITAEETLRRFVGMSRKSVRKLIFEETGIDFPSSLFSEIQEKTLERLEMGLTPLMTPVLKSLEQQNVPRCVASSSPLNRIIRSLELTHQKSYFKEEAIFTAQMVKRGKPNPDLFLHAAKHMGFAPANCLVIEDSPAGIEAAQAAQMKVIGFLGGIHAQHDWYQERLSSYTIPLVHHTEDLKTLLDDYLWGEDDYKKAL